MRSLGSWLPYSTATPLSTVFRPQMPYNVCKPYRGPICDHESSRKCRRYLSSIDNRSSEQRAAYVEHSLAPLALFYNDVYTVPLPPNHRFPMDKYRQTRAGLEQELGTRVTFKVSPLVTEKELQTTHSSDYIRRFLDGNLTDRENRVIGFPWSRGSVSRALSSVGGTVAAMRTVCTSPNNKEDNFILFAGQVAGGTHHAFYDRGEGFCVFSDIAVACNVALQDYPTLVKKILIIDLDVHQGNGNAKLFESNSRVFTFSVHCSGNYFSARQKSDLDIEVAEGTQDDEYLKIIESWVPKLVQEVNPDLIFFQAGVDPLSCDRLGKLLITRTGLSKRNRIVYETALKYKKRLVVTMGGGYPRDMTPGSQDYIDVVRAHMDVYRDAAETLQNEKVINVQWD